MLLLYVIAAIEVTLTEFKLDDGELKVLLLMLAVVLRTCADPLVADTANDLVLKVQLVTVRLVIGLARVPWILTPRALSINWQLLKVQLPD